MDTIFINLKNSKNCKPHVLIIRLINKLDLRIAKNNIVLSNISIY